jgi:hypothetical protein
MKCHCKEYGLTLSDFECRVVNVRTSKRKKMAQEERMECEE